MFRLLRNHNIINLMHILTIAPLFYYIGTNNIKNEHKIYFIYMSIFIALYHAYSMYKRR